MHVQTVGPFVPRLGMGLDGHLGGKIGYSDNDNDNTITITTNATSNTTIITTTLTMNTTSKVGEGVDAACMAERQVCREIHLYRKELDKKMNFTFDSV